MAKGFPTRTDADLCAAVELLAYDLRVIGAASKPLEGHEQARATATAAIGVAVTDLLTIVRGYCLRGLGEAQLEQICRLALDLLDECRDENAVPIPDSVFAVAGGTFTDMADTLDGWVARHSSR